MRYAVRSIGVAVALLVSCDSSAIAQSACDAVLIPTQIDQSLDREQELALATLIDSEEEYERAVGAGISGSYGLFSAGASYQDFEREKGRLLQQQDFRVSEAEAQRLVTSFLPEALADRWVECHLASSGGVLLYVEDIAPDAVTVVVNWRPRPGQQEPLPLQTVELRGTLNDAMVIREQLPGQWLGSEARGFILDRQPDQALRLLIGIGGTVDHIYLPAQPDEAPAPEVADLCACTGQGNIIGGMTLWGPAGQYCAGMNGAWGEYDLSCVADNRRICKCSGYGGVEGVAAWGPEGAPCWGIEDWGTYSIDCAERTSTRLCGCRGRGGVEGVLLYGPEGKDCAGMNGRWGLYDGQCR